MKFEHALRYDAPVDVVLAMLTDPEFRLKVADAQQARSASCTVEAGTVVLELVTPNSDIPGFARAFAGETTRSIVTERWSGTTAAFAVETPGKPSAISGTRRLVADEDGTLETFEAEAKAKVPLIGGRIERLIVSQFKEGAALAHGVGVAWLAGR